VLIVSAVVVVVKVVISSSFLIRSRDALKIRERSFW